MLLCSNIRSIDQANNVNTLLINFSTATNNVTKDRSVENINPNISTNVDMSNKNDNLLSFIEIRKNTINMHFRCHNCCAIQYLEKSYLLGVQISFRRLQKMMPLINYS